MFPRYDHTNLGLTNMWICQGGINYLEGFCLKQAFLSIWMLDLQQHLTAIYIRGLVWGSQGGSLQFNLPPGKRGVPPYYVVPVLTGNFTSTNSLKSHF